LEICSYVNGRYKQECYAQFGCDGQRVEQYFHAVEVLENAWEQGAAHGTCVNLNS
jgi:hypothetical protein